MDFWVSRISTFQSGFWILFEKPLFVILKIVLMNSDVFSAQVHTEYNVTGTSQFTATQRLLRAYMY